MPAENSRAAVSPGDHIPPRATRDRCAKRAIARITHTLPPCARSEQDSRQTRTNTGGKRLQFRVIHQRFPPAVGNAESTHQATGPAPLPRWCFAPAHLRLEETPSAASTEDWRR